MDRPLVLITGAGGMIAPELADRIADSYDIRMSDRNTVSTPYDFVLADLTDSGALNAACNGVDMIVHLGAVTWDFDVSSIMIPSNILGTYNLFEAARKNGVEKIVFASSHHTVGFHHRDGTLGLDENAELRPDTYYAVTKIYGEALGRWYAEKCGMSVLCLRIGYYMTDKRIQEGLTRHKEALVLSAEDFAGMVRCCLADTETRFGVFNCISRARNPWLSTRRAEDQLGYRPRDTVESIFGPNATAKPLGDADWQWLYESPDHHENSPER